MSRVRYITRCALFCALGALLPQAFHVFGVGAGQTFLPMHIPTMCAGLFMGTTAGAVTGAVSPLLSSLLTGGSMPTLVKLPFMMLELAAYGAASATTFSCLKKTRLPLWPRTALSVLAAQIVGRAVNLLCTVLVVHLFGVTSKAVSTAAVWTAVLTGFPGILLQLLVLPTLLVALQSLTHPSASNSDEK